MTDPAQLDRQAVTPLYTQIAHILRGEIAAAQYDQGPLPSEAALQRRFDISRVTARQALRQLNEEGLVEARRGKGTFVAQSRIRHALGTARGFYDELLLQGVIPDAQLVGFGKQASGDSRLEAAGLTTRLERHYAVDHTPLAIAISWLPAGAAALGASEADSRTIYGLIEDALGHRIASVETTIGASAADAKVAAALDLDDAPFVLTLTRRSHDEGGALREATIFHLRPDRYEFVLHTEGPLHGAHARIRSSTA